MASFLDILVPVSVGAVAIVLLFGLRNMLKAGSSDTSQKLMRWRVILQALAVVIIMVAVYVQQNS